MLKFLSERAADLPFDDPWHVLTLQTLDSSIDFQVFLQRDPGPQRTHLRTVAHMLQRTVHPIKLCAVVTHQHLDAGEQTSSVQFDFLSLQLKTRFDL